MVLSFRQANWMGFKWHTHTIWLSRANSVSVWHFLFGAICTNYEFPHVLRWCSSLSSFSEHLVGGWSASLSCQSVLSLMLMMDVAATFGITYSFPHFSKLSSLTGPWQSPLMQRPCGLTDSLHQSIYLASSDKNKNNCQTPACWSQFLQHLTQSTRHAAGGAVGSGTVVQAGSSRVRFPLVSLKFFIDISFPAALGP
jgi:hypothetical protein